MLAASAKSLVLGVASAALIISHTDTSVLYSVIAALVVIPVVGSITLLAQAVIIPD